MRNISVLSVVAALAAAAPSQNWALITPTTQPSVRRAGAMAFDGTRLIMYGGLNPTPSVILNETWAYTNSNWSLLAPVGGAPGRWGHQMVRNTVLNRLVTFGGRSPTISGYADDTYAWNITASTWTPVTTPSAPARRYLYGLSFDSVRNKVVLFGGYGLAPQPNPLPFATLGDTWELTMDPTGTSGVWQQVTVATPPPAREDMAMVFDTFSGRTFLFGGINRDTNTILGDTWAYDGTDWTQLTPETSPTPRYRMACVYDSFRQRPVMYGGFDGAQIQQQTYEFLIDNWFLKTTTNPGSANATEMYAGYFASATPAQRKFVTFGGAGAVFSNQTHEYTGGVGGAFSLFGTACASPVGIATISAAAPPTLGQTLNLTFGPLPSNASLMVVAIGLAPLVPPVDLGFLGLPACDLLVSPDVLQVVLATGPQPPPTPATAAFAFPIPNQPSLVNVSVYLQGVSLDATLVDFIIGVTRGGRAILGI